MTKKPGDRVAASPKKNLTEQTLINTQNLRKEAEILSEMTRNQMKDYKNVHHIGVEESSWRPSAFHCFLITSLIQERKKLIFMKTLDYHRWKQLDPQVWCCRAVVQSEKHMWLKHEYKPEMSPLTFIPARFLLSSSSWETRRRSFAVISVWIISAVSVRTFQVLTSNRMSDVGGNEGLDLLIEFGFEFQRRKTTNSDGNQTEKCITSSDSYAF